MNEDKQGFTPGPWSVVDGEENYGDVRCLHIDSPTWIVALALADSNALAKQAPYNARLIAAAPELFKAASRVLAGLNIRIETAALSAVPVFDGIAELSAALAKAQGQS